jgi:hypothetical protein
MSREHNSAAFATCLYRLSSTEILIWSFHMQLLDYIKFQCHSFQQMDNRQTEIWYNPASAFLTENQD